jgi:hypothetical protein
MASSPGRHQRLTGLQDLGNNISVCCGPLGQLKDDVTMPVEGVTCKCLKFKVS